MERGVVEGGKQAWMSLNSTYNPMTVSLQENKGWEGSLGKGEEARILVFPRENHRWDLKLKTFKLVLEKAEEPEIKLPPCSGSSKKQESSRKTSMSALLTMPKLLIVFSLVQLLSRVRLFVTPQENKI